MPLPFVPSAASEPVQKLREDLGSDAPAMSVRVKTEDGDQPRDCYINVRKRLEQDTKAKMRLGWAVWQHSNVFIEAEPHAVLDRGDGTPWVDCTPHQMPDGSMAREILFIPNDVATYDFDTTDLADNVRVPLLDDPRLREALSLMSEKVKLMNSVPGFGELPQDVAANIYRVEMQAAQLFTEVMEPHAPAGQKVGRNDPCPCGSTKKYKKCCGR